MTDEQINRAIAEACGWTDIDGLSAKGLMGNPPELLRSFNYIPDYCTDLNAIHDALMTLKDYRILKYYTQMLEAVVDEPLRFYAIRATARQHAEAFLRTFGKWEEVQG